MIARPGRAFVTTRTENKHWQVGERKTYWPGKDGAEVILFVIHGGGHAWPGRDVNLPFLGKSPKNIPANDLMWEFFTRHPMR